MFAHERSLVRKYEGRPFVLLGVDEDDEREDLQRTEKKYDLNWRSWWDEDHSIAGRWNVRAFPTLFLLDHKGFIRWQSLGTPDMKEMEAAIERLVKEAESEGGKQAALSRNR